MGKLGGEGLAWCVYKSVKKFSSEGKMSLFQNVKLNEQYAPYNYKDVREWKFAYHCNNRERLTFQCSNKMKESGF